MARGEVHKPPSKDYSSVKQHRRLEILCFVCPAVVMAVGVSAYLVSRGAPPVKTNLESCSPNSTQHMEDITESARRRLLADGSISSEDGIVYTPGAYWIDQNETVWGCPCVIKPCLHKCCGVEEQLELVEYTDEDTGVQSLVATNCTSNEAPFRPKRRPIYSKDFLKLEKVTVDDNHFFVINGFHRCPFDTFLLGAEDDRNAFLLEDGWLFRRDSRNQPLSDYEEFCVDYSSNTHEVHFMMCFGAESQEIVEELRQEWKFFVKGVGTTVSIPFLVITFLVYTLLPQLRNLHGKTLMCFVACLTVAFSCMAATHLVTFKASPSCSALGFAVQFSVLASFFWLNVMCFDIWWVFSGLMPLRGTQQYVEGLKLAVYSTYAWGSPLVILAVSLVMEYAPFVPQRAIKPNMGIVRCFFADDDARLMYLYLPIGILVYLNTAMFLSTALRFRAHSKTIKVLARGDSRRHCQAGTATSDTQRFGLYVKLFVMMGVNWLLELLSFSLKGSSFVWLIIDLFNALIGIFLFYVYVCKRPVLRMLNHKLCPGLRVFATDRVRTDSTGRRQSSTKFSSGRCNSTVHSGEDQKAEQTLV